MSGIEDFNLSKFYSLRTSSIIDFRFEKNRQRAVGYNLGTSSVMVVKRFMEILVSSVIFVEHSSILRK